MALFTTFLVFIAFFGFITVSLSEDYIYSPDVDMEYKFHKEQLPWYDAKLKCASENAELAMPKNEAEVTAIIIVFQGFPASMFSGITYTDHVWLGLHDIFLESEYVTIKGEPMQYYFHSWRNSQPDNYENEDCVTLYRSGGLNDLGCNIPSFFICQKKGYTKHNLESSQSVIGGDPEYHYAPGINKYYKLHMNPRRWADARAICFAEGGHLAIIRNQAEEIFLMKLFNDPKNKVNFVGYTDNAYIGIHDMYREAHFTTVLDEDLNDIGYKNWSPGEPNNDDGIGNCVTILKTGKLNDVPCELPAVFICEKEYANLIDI